MSTIIYRNGLMVADTRAFSGDRFPIGQKHKMRHFDGLLAGISTPQPGLSECLMDWIKDGADPHDFPPIQQDDFEILTVDSDRQVFFYSGFHWPAGPLKAEYVVIGSGSEVARGALESGKNILEALHIVAKMDPFTAGPFEGMIHGCDMHFDEEGVRELLDSGKCG